jgi:putative membrane protein
MGPTRAEATRGGGECGHALLVHRVDRAQVREVVDPSDPRALLAIERTLLAWLRTGLSLIAFGFLIARIGVWLDDLHAAVVELRYAPLMGAIFAALGTVANLMALYRYLAFRKAVLNDAAAPTSSVGLLSFAGSVVLLGALLSFYVLSKLR